MTRNSFWTLGGIGDEARGGSGKEGTLYTRGHSASGCFGLKSSRNHKLGATALLHRPCWQTEGGQPHKSLGSLAVI